MCLPEEKITNIRNSMSYQGYYLLSYFCEFSPLFKLFGFLVIFLVHKMLIRFVSSTLSVLKFSYLEKATQFLPIFYFYLTLPNGVKLKVEYGQNFLAFPEYLNFTRQNISLKFIILFFKLNIFCRVKLMLRHMLNMK